MNRSWLSIVLVGLGLGVTTYLYLKGNYHAAVLVGWYTTIELLTEIASKGQ